MANSRQEWRNQGRQQDTEAQHASKQWSALSSKHIRAAQHTKCSLKGACQNYQVQPTCSWQMPAVTSCQSMRLIPAAMAASASWAAMPGVARQQHAVIIGQLVHRACGIKWKQSLPLMQHRQYRLAEISSMCA